MAADYLIQKEILYYLQLFGFLRKEKAEAKRFEIKTS